MTLAVAPVETETVSIAVLGAPWLDLYTVCSYDADRCDEESMIHLQEGKEGKEGGREGEGFVRGGDSGKPCSI